MLLEETVTLRLVGDKPHFPMQQTQLVVTISFRAQECLVEEQLALYLAAIWPLGHGHDVGSHQSPETVSLAVLL